MFLFGFELGATGVGETIEFGAAASVGHAPFGGDPSATFETMEGGVEGALLEGETVLGNDGDAFGNVPAVEGTGGECLEDEEVERALK